MLTGPEGVKTGEATSTLYTLVAVEVIVAKPVPVTDVEIMLTLPAGVAKIV